MKPTEEDPEEEADSSWGEPSDMTQKPMEENCTLGTAASAVLGTKWMQLAL